MEICDLKEVCLFLLMAFASQKPHLLTLKARNNEGFEALCISGSTGIYEDGGQLVHVLVILVFQKTKSYCFLKNSFM